MKHREVIEEVTDEILSEQLDLNSLKNKLDELKSLLLKITNLDLEKHGNKDDLHFENGMALSSSFAALCIDDAIRTRQFVRGIFAAVKQVSSHKPKPIKILYAGTGPFATLILPLLTKYSPEEIQLILIEVNKRTVKYLKRLIKELKIEDYIEKIICEDASKCKIPKEPNVDIIISETMQHGLVREQQVPIMLNLINQLNENVIMIPNLIRLDLALMNTRNNLMTINTEESKYKVLKNLLEFDKPFIHSNFRPNKRHQQNERFELCKRVLFRNDNNDFHDKLVILTSIQVHDEEWINIDCSGLTAPKFLLDLQTADKQKKEISMDYVINRNPDFEFEIN